MNDYDYMALALGEARKAYLNDEVPVGAVITKNGAVVSKAYNMKEKNKCSLEHAELIVIREASEKLNNWRLNDTAMYVTLEPCPMCASAIKQSRISKIVYLIDNINADNSKIVDEILSSKDANIPVEKVKLDISKFNEDDVMIISNFFKKRRH